MAYYKIYNTGSGEISNIIEWNGTGSFTWPSGYDIALYTGSLSGSNQWSGSIGGVSTQAGLFFGELTGAASGSFTGSLTGSFNNYSGSLGWIYDFPTGSFRTGSFTGSFTGSLEGTASYATTASYVLGGGGATVTSPGNDRIITSDGTSTGLVAESNISFNGVNLSVTGSIILAGTREINMSTGSLSNPLLKGYYETMVSKSVSSDYMGGIVNIDLSQGNIYKIVLDGNVNDFAIQNNPTALQVGSFTLLLQGDGTARTFNWGGEVTWPGGAPSVVSTLGNVDVYAFYTFNSGTEYLGLVIEQNQSGLV